MDLTPKARETRAETNKWDYSQNKKGREKNLCIVKKAINKTKRQPPEWEKIFESHTTDKGLISEIYLKTHKIQQWKASNLVKKGQFLNRHFFHSGSTNLPTHQSIQDFSFLHILPSVCYFLSS